MIRALIGGLVGAVLGTGIWLGAENITSRNLPWLAILVGLLAGLGVRMVCQTDQRSPVTGTMAAVAALAGLIGGNFANLAILNYNFDRQEVPVINSDYLEEDEPADADSADAETDGDTGSSDEEGDDVTADDERDADAERESMDEQVVDSGIRQVSAINHIPAVGAMPLVFGQAAEPGSFSNTDLAIYVISAILAYLLGTGKGNKPVAPVAGSSATEESA